MFSIWLNRVNSIRDYNGLIRYGYNLTSIEDKEVVDLWNKVIDACIYIDEEDFIYQGKAMDLLESNRMVIEFFKELYGTDLIINDLAHFFDITTYMKATDYRNVNAQISRKFDLGSREINSFCIDFYGDIITSDLIVHEFSHGLYIAPVECLYDEVISMTFEKIFANANHSDLEVLNSLSAFKSSFYEGSLMVSDDTLKGKIKCIEKLYAKKYLIGYIASIYLLEKYKDDPKVFRRLITLYRDDKNAPKRILNYYGFNFKSNEVDALLEKDIEKVKKRMYS